MIEFCLLLVECVKEIIDVVLLIVDSIIQIGGGCLFVELNLEGFIY